MKTKLASEVEVPLVADGEAFYAHLQDAIETSLQGFADSLPDEFKESLAETTDPEEVAYRSLLSREETYEAGAALLALKMIRKMHRKAEAKNEGIGAGIVLPYQNPMWLSVERHIYESLDNAVQALSGESLINYEDLSPRTQLCVIGGYVVERWHHSDAHTVYYLPSPCELTTVDRV